MNNFKVDDKIWIQRLTGSRKEVEYVPATVVYSSEKFVRAVVVDYDYYYQYETWELYLPNPTIITEAVYNSPLYKALA